MRKHPFWFWYLWLFSGLLLIAGGQQATPQDLAFYAREVRPLLEKRCFACHSSKGAPQANLRLDSRAGWLRGGISGPAILPGDTEQSRLLKAVRYRGEAT